MFNKPVINVGYNPPSIETSVIDYARYYTFDHYRPVVESGAVSVASSEDEMRTLLSQALKQPHEQSFRRRALIQKMFGNTLDGKSGVRVAEQLLELANNSAQSRVE
jgi:hypothetical protein